MDRISPYFKYALILTRSRLELLGINFSLICNRVMALYSHQNFIAAQYLENKFIFRIFVTEFWALIDIRISFPLNILKTNRQNFTKFYICIHIDKILVGIATHHFLHICFRVRPLIYIRILFPSISLEQIDRITPNFMYTFILTRSWL